MHDGDAEHYHDDGTFAVGPDDTVTWTTVGLDVGSTTSQAVFSRISLARDDSYYVVVDRRTLHESEVILTPYRAPRVIDRRRLSSFIDEAFAAAGLDRAAIDTGAVILTGLALTATNARAIADALSDDAGKLVAVSAGDLLEARLAASGAGLAGLSADRDGVIVHIDVGGGTTKLSAWHRGKLLGLAALDVGARLITLDARGRIERIEPPIAQLAADSGMALRVGMRLDRPSAERLASALAQAVLAHAGLLEGEPTRAALMERDSTRSALLRTPPLFPSGPPRRPTAVIFSGGVSEYIYGRERRTFGDLGLWLGKAIRRQIEECGVEMLPSERGIRATVLGASQHSAQLSGNTVFVSDSAPLPLRNVPVLMPPLDLGREALDLKGLQRGIGAALAMHERSALSHAPALAIRWAGAATFARLSGVARVIAAALDAHLGEGDPCVVLVEGDVAGVLGRRLAGAFEGRRAVVCLDGVHVHELDHLDVGELMPRTRTVPVVVKSLLFAGPFHAAHQHSAHHPETHHHD